MDWEGTSHPIPTTENCPPLRHKFLPFSYLINRSHKIHKMGFLLLNRLLLPWQICSKEHLQERPWTLWKQANGVWRRQMRANNCRALRRGWNGQLSSHPGWPQTSPGHVFRPRVIPGGAPFNPSLSCAFCPAVWSLSTGSARRGPASCQNLSKYHPPHPTRLGPGASTRWRPQPWMFKWLSDRSCFSKSLRPK